jgi:hypothetical protein
MPTRRAPRGRAAVRIRCGRFRSWPSIGADGCWWPTMAPTQCVAVSYAKRATSEQRNDVDPMRDATSAGARNSWQTIRAPAVPRMRDNAIKSRFRCIPAMEDEPQACRQVALGDRASMSMSIGERWFRIGPRSKTRVGGSDRGAQYRAPLALYEDNPSTHRPALRREPPRIVEAPLRQQADARAASG